ncbi:cytochrome b N-terminal domain-containing protein [Anatilimnocola floriformis]|uniref:cytochrome b N-terminal domain-containing protein n=1 Tax=Anatilimnocola floriformis TaxID=2948575 RepID=UPI0020C5924B|nr:cytochrome b N-terminal domain-containing protein [Anatilimnocola floriformis]
MIRQMSQWLDRRIGYNQMLADALYEPIPGGARWRYITGSMLVFAFSVQAITGIFLWMAYSPSSQTAYESVYYIQHEMTGGWLLRGLHHFMAQAMVVVMGIHLLQVIVDGAYRAPREVNYWLGLVLMQIVMGLGLTGYLLPWDQKGYWATNVATNLATLVPVVGKDLQLLAVGGSEYGHHTLTRFFAMHTGVLPALLVIFLAAHIAVFRKHGITTHPRPGDKNEYFWPKQVLFDAVGCLVLLTIVLLCVIHWDLPNAAKGTLPLAHQGAELGAPADPSEPYDAARPEWYYLFLFQLLKYFHGTQEVIGALVIPGIVMTVLALAPFIGISKLGHKFNIAFILFLIAGAGVLTVLALREDAGNADFQKARVLAEHNAQRTYDLINRREWQTSNLSDKRFIQRSGAVDLLRNDPLTQGPRLFSQHCASCHDYRGPAADAKPTAGEEGHGHEHQAAAIRLANQKLSPLTKEGETNEVNHETGEKKKALRVVRDAAGKVQYPTELPYAGAPNLYGFASREWIKGFLTPEKLTAVRVDEAVPSANKKVAADEENPDNHLKPIIADYFGHTNHREGRMVDWLKKHAGELNEKIKGPDGKETPNTEIEAIVAALSAQAQLRSQTAADEKDKELIGHGVKLVQQYCTNECHRFGDHGQLGLAPDLTHYGSYEWMLGFVADPTHERFYQNQNDRMPQFAKNIDEPHKNSVSIRELSLIVAWLRGDYYDPADTQPRLPPTEEYARRVVRESMLGEKSRELTIVGAERLKATSDDQARQLFVANCSQCHSRSDATGGGIVAKRPTAPNLQAFGSREWLTGLLDPKQIASDRYFGKTKHKQGDMVNFVRDNFSELDEEGKKAVTDIIATLSAEANLPAQAAADKAATDDGSIMRGRTAFATSFASSSCVDCHKFHDKGDVGAAPDLTGWASQEWLERFIADPGHADLYGDNNDRMPRFAKSGPGVKPALLSKPEITLLAKWLRGEVLD